MNKGLKNAALAWRRLAGRACMLAVACLWPAAPAAQEQARASRVNPTPPTIDGRLEDVAWKHAAPITRFRQKNPVEGADATEATDVRFLYSDRDLFVGFRAFDREAARVVARLTRRDQETAADEFELFIDSYRDRRTAFAFTLNPSGARRDVLIFDDGAGRDDSWDPVYDWATSVDSLGWTAELRIPFSQLRFTSTDSLSFGLRIRRVINRKNEEVNWPFVPRDQAGEVSRYGDLIGLQGLPARRRLELLPYISSARHIEPGIPGASFDLSRSRARAGLDAKIGVTSGLTLDLTFNPDFGQVEADPAVVNLTEFESFFPEKRPFFVEGTNLFRGNLPGGGELIYTRRIGRTPQINPRAGSLIADVPDATTILGAGKLTGQVGGGWNVGLLQAVTAREQARILSLTGAEERRTPVEPLTSYTALRLQRNTRQGRMTYGGVLTGVYRNLDETHANLLHRRAFSGAVDMRWRFARDAYDLGLALGGTRVDGSSAAILRTQQSPARYYQRPDRTYAPLDSTRTSLSGYAGSVQLTKNTGFVSGRLAYSLRSPGFEPNDFGFMQQTDEHNQSSSVRFRWLEPSRVFRRFEWLLFQGLNWTYGGERGFSGFYTSADAQLLNYWEANVNMELEPGHLDPRLLRGGPAVQLPRHWHINGSINSDRRRPLFVDLGVTSWLEGEGGHRQGSINGGLTWRPGGPAALSATAQWTGAFDDRQFITSRVIETNTQYVLADISRREVSLTLRADVTLSPRLSLQLYAEPFVSVRRYPAFKLVRDPRAPTWAQRFDSLGADRLTRPGGNAAVTVDIDRNGTADITFPEPDTKVTSLRTNTVLRWEFRRGSTLFLVWNQNRYGETRNGSLDYRHDFGETFIATGRHVLAVKAAYWIGL